MTQANDVETSPGDHLRLLVMFSLLNTLIYMDRGAISSNGINADGVVQVRDLQKGPWSVGSHSHASLFARSRQDFDVSIVRDGLLPSAFMIGLLISSPIFASLASSPTRNEMHLIAYGLLVWAVSVMGCAMSMGFWGLLLCRMAVGVGEASFVALAAPYINDAAPPDRKTLWLAVFYACIPVGYALGFLYGGTVAVAFGWRVAFALESLMMLPFIVYAYVKGGRSTVDSSVLLPDPTGPEGAAMPRSPMFEFLKDTVRGRHRTFLLVTLALTCYTGVIGSYAVRVVQWWSSSGRTNILIIVWYPPDINHRMITRNLLD
jgi:MFS family permease